jgi:hypothetical protein
MPGTNIHEMKKERVLKQQHTAENPLPHYCWFLKDCTEHNMHSQQHYLEDNTALLILN